MRVNKSAPIVSEKAGGANSQVRTNRRNVRRVDYKEGTLAAATNSSALPAYDKSAPSEFAVPTNPLLDRAELESPEMFDDSHFEDSSNLKRQKI